MSRERFVELFGSAPAVDESAPGRVNLIGEHTDYNGGFVLPTVIPQTTRVFLSPRPGDRARVASLDRPGELMEYTVGRETRRRAWVDYVAGVTRALRERDVALGGFDALIASNVPIGAGLSSSAALEVALARALRTAFELPCSDLDLAAAGHAAENGLVGVPTGRMDQLAVSLGAEHAALLLDTRHLAFERIPIPDTVDVLVLDSGVRHGLTSGDYARRRSECERAARELGVAELRDVEVAARVAELPPPLDRRARHVVFENMRVLEAADCLRRGDVVRLGALFSASHASLRDDFEVSVPAVDALVAALQAESEDVYGARMTGGGFGGAVVALVRSGRGPRVAEAALREHARSFRGASVLVDGRRRIA
ncbi:MAG: galactokinase [Polyangiaceae bacterium]